MMHTVNAGEGGFITHIHTSNQVIALIAYVMSGDHKRTFIIDINVCCHKPIDIEHPSL